MNTEEQLMTRNSLALKLNVTERHIQNLELKGLPVTFVGAVARYDYKQVIHWLNKTYYKNLSKKGGDKNDSKQTTN